MRLGIDPKVDYAFKRLFGDPSHSQVLLHLLNAIFENQFQIADVQILSPFLEKDFDDDKLSILDLRVCDTIGRQYNLEMQTRIPLGLPGRLAYYVSSMYSGQLVEGDPYSRLCPAISICLLNKWLLPDTASFHTRFRLSSLEEGIELTDDLEIHLIEFPKVELVPTAVRESTTLEKWVYFFASSPESVGKIRFG